MDPELLYDDSCIICLDDIETEWVTLECQHRYHKKCIQAWMNIRMNCPICIRVIERENIPALNIEEHVINIDEIPDIENNEVAIEGEQTQRSMSLFLCAMLCISIISIIAGFYVILSHKF